MWKLSKQTLKDKASIYNSQQWKILRARKLQAQPLCERCLKEGRYVSAHAVHHRVPIETARTYERMRCLAYDWSNLQSLCDKCHAEVHREAKSHSKQAHKQREEERLARWVESHATK